MKDPAMLFYTSDFLTGVQLMTMKERGQYITLLCLQQQRGHMTRREMEKVVGKMSEELLSKYVEDGEGKLYNRRADYEIARREAHSRRQKENIEKRWHGQSGCVSFQGGNTAVLPLETETETEKYQVVNGVKGTGGEGPLGEAGLERVMASYAANIQAKPPGYVAERLRGYTADLGPEVVCFAIEKSAADKMDKWCYIQAILRDYAQKGVRTLEDARREEAEHRRRGKSGGPAQPPQERPQISPEDLASMRQTLAKLKGG